MTTEPDSIAERTRSIDRSELKMQNNDEQSLEDAADIDSKLVEEFDL